ncbi:AraC family transcriptional regulator [Domibacillus sp. A3M-37]|uniref:AraC family transcriptional regulator n=1 Tax=Domibacillus sp. A3M-37 TaxID=2962037 RepID=UPI0020B7EDBA|nr:AraC family transcriptional regulator [Domibacillus sp. A3M-37]MCP3764822.1 AraC family transcriptional regulator [Domibacillus sp. A3M-37]
MKIRHEKLSLEPFYPFNLLYGSFKEFPMHWHPEMEIVFVEKGEQWVTLRDAMYHLKEKDILLIGSGELHSFPYQPSESKLIILHVGKTIFAPYSDQLFNSECVSPLINLDHYEQEPYYLVRKSIEAMHDYYFTRSEGSELFLKAEIYQLAGLIKKYVPMKPLMNDKKMKRLEQLAKLGHVLAYIEEHFDQDITLEQAADLAGFSPYHFSRVFKKLTGMNFVYYVNYNRIRKSMILLQNNEEPISQIAFKTGFNSIQTFNRQFKELNGCSPSQYRRKK